MLRVARPTFTKRGNIATPLGARSCVIVDLTQRRHVVHLVHPQLGTTTVYTLATSPNAPLSSLTAHTYLIMLRAPPTFPSPTRETFGHIVPPGATLNPTQTTQDHTQFSKPALPDTQDDCVPCRDQANELCTIFNQAAVVTCSLFAALQCQLLALLPDISPTNSSIILNSFLRVFSYSGVILNGAAALYSLISIRFSIDDLQRARMTHIHSLPESRMSTVEFPKPETSVENQESLPDRSTCNPSRLESHAGIESSSMMTIYIMADRWKSFSFTGGFWCFFIQITLLLWVRESLVVATILTVLVFVALLPMFWTFFSQNLQGRTVLMRRASLRPTQKADVV